MYDSTTAADIPRDAEIVAGYVDGRYAWSADDWARFPTARKIRIAVSASTNDGDVLDCEWGDATPQQCPDWIRLRQASGLRIPVIYVADSQWDAVEEACRGLDYDVWVADWTGEPQLVPGSAATQYASAETGSGGHYDLSLCAPDWPQP